MVKTEYHSSTFCVIMVQTVVYKFYLSHLQDLMMMIENDVHNFLTFLVDDDRCIAWCCCGLSIGFIPFTVQMQRIIDRSKWSSNQLRQIGSV